MKCPRCPHLLAVHVAAQKDGKAMFVCTGSMGRACPCQLATWPKKQESLFDNKKSDVSSEGRK